MQALRTVGIIGYGDFGCFLERLASRFVPELTVRIYARNAVVDGVRFFTLEEACRSDLVVIAVSIRAFAETLAMVLPLLPRGSVLVDVNTVKVHPATLLRQQADGLLYITTHPMFGPYSFEKQGEKLDGLRLVITDHTLPTTQLNAAMAWLRRLGLNVLTMTPDAHDHMLAETLFLTHYVAQAVARGGFVRTDIDTLSFGYLMDAVESVQNDTDLFRDVFAFNPHCEAIIARLAQAERDVHNLLESTATKTP